MEGKSDQLIKELYNYLMRIISETNGISLFDTLELASHSYMIRKKQNILKLFLEFRNLLSEFQADQIDIEQVLIHPVATALREYFKNFPMKYRESHIHLTGSLDASFLYPHLMKALDGPLGTQIKDQIVQVYGKDSLPLDSVEALDKLIRLDTAQNKHDHSGSEISPRFDRYLEILILPKLILTTRKIHKEAAYHMANELYHKSNVGHIRLKFTLSRRSAKSSEFIPGIENLTSEDVILGLYEGFSQFKSQYPDFNFILSPSFRKEADFYDNKKFVSKAADFSFQVDEIIEIITKHPQLAPHVVDVDTVGNEKELYRKGHFAIMEHGLKRLQDHGIMICSHHGENWHTLRLGVQSVDNALSIWRIDQLEHGLSLGINPNFYFHRLFERILSTNRISKNVDPNSIEYKELNDMSWGEKEYILHKLLTGTRLNREEIAIFAKIKFHTAREVEHYQHDILNRMIYKDVILTALPSSNTKLTGRIPDYKDHPFSWWEQKGVKQAVGTDNYITLSTDIIKEMMILLVSDPKNLKITKLLMVTTGEYRRPFISKLMWKMREEYKQ